MTAMFDEFKEKLLKDGVSVHVIHEMLRSVVFFAQLMGYQRFINNLHVVSKKDIEEFKKYIESDYLTHEKTRLSEHSINCKLRGLSMYYKFLIDRKVITSDPTEGLALPEKGHPDLKHLPTKEEIDEFASRPDPYSYVGIRDRALILLCYSCVLRTSEYHILDVQNVELEKKRICPPGANNIKYGRTIGLNAESCKALEKYMTVTRPVFAKRSKEPTNRLFLSEWGTPFKPFSIFDIFHKYRGGIRITPYTIRHSRALHMIKSGVKIKDLQKRLGHKSRGITQAYHIVTAKNLNNVYSGFKQLRSSSFEYIPNRCDSK